MKQSLKKRKLKPEKKPSIPDHQLQIKKNKKVLKPFMLTNDDILVLDLKKKELKDEFGSDIISIDHSKIIRALISLSLKIKPIRIYKELIKLNIRKQ